MSTIPSDMVAVADLTSKSFYVYYVDSDGLVLYLKGPVAPQTESSNAKNNPPYDGPKVVQVDGENVRANPNSPKLAVVDYKRNDVWETRIYYLNDKCELQETCWTAGYNDNKWYRGALTNHQFNAAPKSLLTAAVDDNFLKVYYQRFDGAQLWVTWVVVGEEAWSTRRAAEKF